MTIDIAHIESLLAANPELARSAQLKWNDFIYEQPTPKQRAFLMLPHKEAFYGGAGGGGKVVYDNALVLTPFGFCKGIDLSIGQLISNPDGSVSRIIQIHPRRRHQIWRVHFHDGSYTDVAREHLWLAWRSGKRKKRINESQFGRNAAEVIETTELKDWCDSAIHQKANGQVPNWPCIPLCSPQRFNVTRRHKIGLDPYLLGMWLGDGCGTTCNRINFTTADIDHLRHSLRLDNGEWKENAKQGTKARSFWLIGNYLTRWRSSLSRAKLWGTKAATKFVPDEYRLGSLECRIAILQGLLDTDGTIDSRGQVYFTSISKRLVADLTFIVQSLGGTATRSVKDTHYTKDGKVYPGKRAYTLYIKLPNNIKAFRLDRKLERTGVDDLLYRRVVKVELLKRENTGCCITVSHPNGLYITNDFIVTHNSSALLMAATQYVDIPGYAALIMRRTLSELKQSQSLLDRAHEWFRNKEGCGYSASEHTYYFATTGENGKSAEPARISFGYIGQIGDITGAARDRYRSAEYQFIAFDELTQHHKEDYQFLFSRLRKRVCPRHKVINGEPNYVTGCWWCDKYRSLPLRVRSASNPGGLGHLWVKDHFGIKETIDHETGETKFIGTNPERPYIPAFVADNPFIDQSGYNDSLDNLDPVTREQIKRGNWGISQDSRFKKIWFRYYSRRQSAYILGREGRGPICEFQRIFSVVDSAASTKEGPDDDKRYRKQPSWTVIGTFGLTTDYHLLVLDVRRFRKEIPDILPEMRDVYRQWRPSKFIIEAVGSGKGVYQLALKYGLPAEPSHPHFDKIVRSTDAQVRMEQGRIWFPEPPGPEWLERWEAEFLTWTGHPQETDDQIDVLSMAAKDISWEAASVERIQYEDGSSYPVSDLPSVVFSGRYFGAVSPLLNR